MVQVKRLAIGGALVAFGYLLATYSPFMPVRAQDGASLPSDDATKKIAEANDKLKGAVEALKLESRYESATKGINSFAVLVGGLNAKEDLESGHGVDPETFAALYTAAYDLKKLNVKDDSLADWVDITQLDYDSEGRLTYGGKVVRIYPVSRLKKLRAQRLVMIGEARAEPKK
jgi:hypothetical protein